MGLGLGRAVAYVGTHSTVAANVKVVDIRHSFMFYYLCLTSCSNKVPYNFFSSSYVHLLFFL